MTDYLKLAAEVGEITRLAGAAIMEIYETEDFGVEMKSDDSPLTKADKAGNDVIVAGLEALEFQAPIISEEGKGVAYEIRSQYKQFWLVDPLDGTKEFIKRNGEFTVNIALVEAGKPILGAVYVPATGELYYSAKSEGAWKVSDGEPERIAAASFTSMKARRPSWTSSTSPKSLAAAALSKSSSWLPARLTSTPAWPQRWSGIRVLLTLSCWKPAVKWWMMAPEKNFATTKRTC
jgi:3'(2'),5'-bisphosphate nucleotidase